MNVQNLTDEEFEALADWLYKIDPDSLNIEWLDGFLCALHCCPDFVPPSEYLPFILGDSFKFDSEDDVKEFTGLVLKLNNWITFNLHRSVEEECIYEPIIFVDEERKVPLGNDWAEGFVNGMQPRIDAWQPLVEDEEESFVLGPIFALAAEHSEDPELRGEAILDTEREALIDQLVAGLHRTFWYFGEARLAHASRNPKTSRREGPKVGRNDPCPCGSGKKFKQCCMDAPPTVH